MGFRQYSSHFRHKVAVDVGTFYIRVATGAFRLMESPSLSALRAGVVIDSAAAAMALQPLLARTRTCGIVKTHALACAPSDVTVTERERLMDALVKAGAASVVIVPEPLAAAIGAAMDVSQPYAQMIVDIGEGVTDCAVIRSSRLLLGHALRAGCAALRIAVAEQCGITPTQAEGLLRHFGVGPEFGHSGWNSSLRNDVLIETFDKYRSAVEPAVDAISTAVSDFLKQLPVDIGAQVIDSGIVLTGGGALFPGMRNLFETRTRHQNNLFCNPP